LSNSDAKHGLDNGVWRYVQFRRQISLSRILRTYAFQKPFS
jgi:hypothetical protein